MAAGVACGRSGPLHAPFAGAAPATAAFDAGEHPAWDWALPEGTEVVAAADGEVVFSGVEPPFTCPHTGQTVSDQQLVKLQHLLPDGQRLITSYVHLSSREVRAGQRVQVGQRLGASGNTGCSLGPHLHFAVWRGPRGRAADLVAVDPDAEAMWAEAPGAVGAR